MREGEPITLRLSIDIYQPRAGGNIRLSEDVELAQGVTLAEAAVIMSKVAEVFKATLDLKDR